MASAPERSAKESLFPTRRLWTVRGAAIGTMLLMCVPFPPWRWPEMPVAFFMILALFVPFLMILWRLRKAPRKDGLALAIGTGGVLFLGLGPIVIVAGSDPSRYGWGTLAPLALFTMVQAILAGGGIATYKHLGYARGDWKLLTRGVVEPLVYFVVIGFIIAASGPLMYEQRLRRYPVEAVVWMKKLHECATLYASGHPGQGFPARLDLLGLKGTKCIEPLPPNSEKSGYVFSYAPSAPEAGGRIPAYSVTARPVNRGRPGQQSFYMDATGVIRATSEDRDATPQDRAVP
jgi:hypothetical protein